MMFIIFFFFRLPHAGPFALRLPLSMHKPGPGVRARRTTYPRWLRLLSGVRPTGRRPM